MRPFKAMKLSGAIAGSIILLGTLTGCGEPPSADTGAITAERSMDELIKAAQEEGSVTWYVGLTASQIDPTVEAFTKKYDVKVDVVRLASAKLAQRFSTEAEAGVLSCDVLVQSDPAYVADAVSKGWIVKDLTPDVLPDLKDFPADAVSPGSIMTDRYPWGIAYNVESLKRLGVEPPTSFTDLVNPKLKGQILAVDPRAAVGYAGAKYYLYKTFGEDFLKELGEQDLAFTDSIVPGLQQLAAGEKAVLFETIPGADRELIASGAPIKSFYPEQTTISGHIMSLPVKAPHPNAARLLANFLITAEGATPLVAGIGSSPLGALPGSVPVPASAEPIDYENSKAKLPEILKLLKLS